jgi:hypothetical protein
VIQTAPIQASALHGATAVQGQIQLQQGHQVYIQQD